MYAKVTERLFGGPSAPVQIDRYRIEGRLGAGAMGVVYAAFDERLGRRVAIKLLHESFDPVGEARLLREAQAMARLRHENVVQVYDFGTYADQVFIVMEMVEGRTLERWLREAVRSPDDILARFAQAGRALAAAHRGGVLHRDFKPENVLVDSAGRVRVLDFGLARALASEPEDSLSVPITRTGSVLGTPAYMAPEQLRGEASDARADQFSFCVALYEALYNHRPVTAVARFTPVAVIHVPKHNRVPAAVRRALLRGLSEAPSARWPDMDALLAALRPPPRRQGLALAALLLVLGAGIGAWVAASLGPPQSLDVRGTAPERRVHRAAAPLAAPPLGQPEEQLRDSRRAAHVARLLASDPTTAAVLLRELPDDSEGVASMRHQVLAQPLTRFRLTTTELRSLWFDPAGDLWLIDARGARRHDSQGRAVRDASAPAPPQPPPGPGAELWPAPDGGPPLRRDSGRLTLGRHHLREHDGELTAVAWSPSGRLVAVAGAQVLVWNRRGTLVARDDGQEGNVRALRWSPSGDRLLIGGEDGQARILRIDASGTGSTHEPRVLRGHSAPISDLAWHPGGDLVATAASDGSVRVWSLVAGAATRLDHPGTIQGLRWRPDGAHLATASDDGKVRLFPRDGASEPQVLDHGGRVMTLAWSPDGQQLASGGVGSHVRVWGADGRPLRELPTGGKDDVLAVTWTPGGDLLTANNDDRLLLWPAGEGPATPVHPRVQVVDFAVRPDPRGRSGPLELASEGSSARRWTLDLSQGTPTLRELARLGDINDLAYCDDGVLALARDERRVDLLAPDGSQSLRHTGAAAISVACGPALVAGLVDGRIRGWSRGHGREPVELAGHLASVEQLAFSPDGELLASAAAGILYIWPWQDLALAEQLRSATRLCLDAKQRVALLDEPAAQAAQTAAACASRAASD